MPDSVTILEASATSLSVASKLVELIENAEANERNQVGLREIIYDVRSEAITLSTKAAEDLRSLIQELNDSNIPLEQSLSDTYNDLRPWLDFRRRSKLKKLDTRFHEMHRALTGFIDDISAVLICSGTQNSAQRAFLMGFQKKRELDELMMGNPPIGRILQEFIDVADQITVRLQGAEPHQRPLEE